jgi:hypothetical protein
VPFALAACGGSGHPASTAKSTATTTATHSSPAPGGASVTTGPVRATLLGQSHDPVVNKNWSYTVHVADAHGRPLSGTLETEFAFQGAVVGKDTPPTHTFKHGGFEENLKFPPTALGYPIELQVVVHTAAGSVTLDWPVTVKK